MCQADNCLQSSCIVSWGIGCIGSSVDSLDGGDGLTTGLELSHVVLDHSFNSWDEVEGSGKVVDSGRSAAHEIVAVGEGDLGISQPQQDVSELHLLRVLSC